MKQLYLTLLLVITSSLALLAQFEEISVGAGYANQVYYSLHSGTSTTIDHTDWDIAFGVSPQGSGIFVNEGVAASFGAPAPEVQAFYSIDEDFDTADTMNIIDRIYNPEVSWDAGAFNSIADIGNPFDLGWGTYNPSNHSITSNYIFFVQLRSGSWRKLEIQSLAGGVYTFRHANLDGSELVEQTIDKADFTGKTLAYYNMESNEVLDLEPAQWDLVFTRYTTPLDDGEGGLLEYVVTGGLSNAGVSIAQADDIDPATVSYQDYTALLEDTLTTIGHDWKFFDFTTGWGIVEDRVYFVKTATDSIWKVQFLDFAGSSTGNFTIQKTFEGLLVNNEELVEQTTALSLFPNPVIANQTVNIHWTLQQWEQSRASLTIINHLGQQLHQQTVELSAGANRFECPAPAAAGMYWLQLQVGQATITRPFVVAQ